MECWISEKYHAGYQCGLQEKDDPEVQESLHFVRPNAKWSKSPEPVVLIDPDTGEEFVDFPEETISERIRKVLDSFLVIERTSDIDVLFSRYDMILDTLDELKKYEKWGSNLILALLSFIT